MRIKHLLNFACGLLLAGAVTPEASAMKVKLSRIYATDDPILVNKATGDTIDTGETESYARTFECAPGTYIFSKVNRWAVNAGDRLEVEVQIPDIDDYPEDGYPLTIATYAFYPTNSGFVKGTDWKADSITVYHSGQKAVFTIGDYNRSGVDNGYTFLAVYGDKVQASFSPLQSRPDHLSYFVEKQLTSSGYSATSFAFPEMMDFTLTIPAGATAEVSYKKSTTHYVPFAIVDPASEVVNGDKKTITYKVEKAAKDYAYRVRRDGCMTQAAIFSPTSVPAVEVTEEQLSQYTNRYFDHNIEGRGMYYADIFLNINNRHYLPLKQGEEFQIVNLRTWQLTNSTTGNYFLEPDYHYTVLNTDFQPDNSVVTVSETGVLKPQKPGTAIVQVRYDAMGLDVLQNALWSELWAENTGTFVVTVDADTTNLPVENFSMTYRNGNRMDAEHDIMYYMKGQPGRLLTFKPTEGATVTVANPLLDETGNNVSYPDGFSSKNVTVNADGSVTVLLTYGRNIIRTEKDGKANYQVLSAKPVSMDLVKARSDNYVLPGDKVGMQFKGLFHVAGKLAGVYNSNCHIAFEDVVKDLGVLLGNGQYDFAGNASAQRFEVAIGLHTKGDTIVGRGRLGTEGYGSSPGAHRGINYITGMDPNFSAGIGAADYGSIPDQTISVTDFKDAGRLKVVVNLGGRCVVADPEAIKAAFGENARWVSADEKIARVINERGQVIPSGAGNTVIYLVNSDSQTIDDALLYCDVEVPEAEGYISVTGMSFSESTDVKKLHMNFSWGNWGNNGNVLYVNVTPSDATNKNVIFTTSDARYVAVGKKYLTTYESTYCPLFWGEENMPGEAVITAETVDGAYTAQIKVCFLKGATTFNIDTDSIGLTIGESRLLVATVEPSYCSYSPSWTSSDESVATVDENGNVTAVGAGTAVIKGSVRGNGASSYTVSCKVTVSEQSAIDLVTVSDSWEFGPNPNRGILNIDSPQGGRLSVYNLSGALVRSVAIEAGHNTVNLEGLRAGMYLLNLNGRTEKLIMR